MLEAFLRFQEIDILLLQEVTQHILDNLHGYTTHYNIGTTMRGTAIVTRDEIQLVNVSKLPSGRAIAAKFREVWIINIYAPAAQHAGKNANSSTTLNWHTCYEMHQKT